MLVCRSPTSSINANSGTLNIGWSGIASVSPLCLQNIINWDNHKLSYYFVPAFLNRMGMGVCRSNTETPGSGTGPWACNPNPLNRSLHLLNETISLQLFLEKLKGEEKAGNLSKHDSIRGHFFLKLLYFSQHFMCSRSLWITNYQSRPGGSVLLPCCVSWAKNGSVPSALTLCKICALKRLEA